MILLEAYGVGFGRLHCQHWGVLCALRSVSAGQDSDRQVSGVYQLSVELLDGGGWFQCVHWCLPLWLVWLFQG